MFDKVLLALHKTWTRAHGSLYAFVFLQTGTGWQWNWAWVWAGERRSLLLYAFVCSEKFPSIGSSGSMVKSVKSGEGGRLFSSALIFVDIAEVALMVFVLRVVSSCDFLVDLGRNFFFRWVLPKAFRSCWGWFRNFPRILERESRKTWTDQNRRMSS